MAHTTSKAEQGFTLVELAIVLVIIGLIIGGVLVGKDMIDAAAERATIGQVGKFNTAVNAFRLKYDALPGDIADPDATRFGFAPRGTHPGQGDGNGILQGIAGDWTGTNYGPVQVAGETSTFWVDLSTAHMMDGSFSTASPFPPSFDWNASPLTGPGLANWFPKAKLGSNYFYVYSNTGNDGGTGITGTPVNYYGLSAVWKLGGVNCNGCLHSTPGLTVQQAYDIDAKIDDGMPQTGKVIAQYEDLDLCSICYAPNWFTPSTGTCFDTTSGNYSTSQGGSKQNCALSFQLP